MITPQSSGADVLSTLVQYFDEQYNWRFPNIVDLLKASACVLRIEKRGSDSDEYIYDCYVLTFYVPPKDVPTAQNIYFTLSIQEAFEVIVDAPPPVKVDVVIKALLPAVQHTTGLNNCFFKREKTYTHDELRFRSKGEIAIYDELKSRRVLFFPNAAGVLGTDDEELNGRVEKREPDFLICYKGKWGMLEVNGDDFHTGIIQTAKDHDRARKFNHYGVFFIQAFAKDRCEKRPGEVVDEFLTLLEKYK